MDRVIARIAIPVFESHWSDWCPWEDLLRDRPCGEGAPCPPNAPGVYKAKLLDSEVRLTIGKDANLRMRVKQGLVKGKSKRSSGRKMRANDGVACIVVR